MTFAEQRQARAARYRAQAGAELALIETSGLLNVREKHETAAARWTALAEIDERPQACRDA
jgi:hypothetical protein